MLSPEGAVSVFRRATSQKREAAHPAVNEQRPYRTNPVGPGGLWFGEGLFLAGRLARLILLVCPLAYKSVLRVNTETPVFRCRCHHRRILSTLAGEMRAFVYNVELVQQLCQDIAAEQDSQKVQELLSLLRAVLKEHHEETRIRRAFLAKKYAEAISESKAAD